MKAATIAIIFTLLAASNPLFAIMDRFEEIEPSNEIEGYHTKLRLKKQGDGKLLLTLPRIETDPVHQAWLVVCKKPRGKGRRNFRYEVYWPESKANKLDIESVFPIKFEKSGKANIQLTDDLASRSYIVFGGHFDDGTFYTVNLPAFRKALDEAPKGEQQGGADTSSTAVDSKAEEEMRTKSESKDQG